MAHRIPIQAGVDQNESEWPNHGIEGGVDDTLYITAGKEFWMNVRSSWLPFKVLVIGMLVLVAYIDGRSRGGRNLDMPRLRRSYCPLSSGQWTQRWSSYGA